jgi:tRNA threonylcarbamoyl adenosine modification protein YjeE
MQIISRSEHDTENFAVQIASSLSGGEVLLLSGELGAGKSVFARALIRALKGDPTLEVPSPTFTLVQTYDTPRGLVWHFDLYRIEDPEEIYEIGWEEALAGGIVIIEWPQRLGALIPHRTVGIGFTIGEPHERVITVTPAEVYA